MAGHEFLPFQMPDNLARGLTRGHIDIIVEFRAERFEN